MYFCYEILNFRLFSIKIKNSAIKKYKVKKYVTFISNYKIIKISNDKKYIVFMYILFPLYTLFPAYNNT